MRQLRLTTSLGLLIVLILSACGGAAPSTSITVTMTDFTFLPNTLTVPAGQEISITVRNNGAVAHDFMIMKLGSEVPSGGHVGSGGHANVYWEQEPLDAGATQTSTFTAPTQPGQYQIVCGVAGHFEAGMHGTLIVVATP